MDTKMRSTPEEGTTAYNAITAIVERKEREMIRRKRCFDAGVCSICGGNIDCHRQPKNLSLPYYFFCSKCDARY